MSDGLGILLKANNSGFIAAMQQAGTVTEREAKRMQSSLKFLEGVARDFKATQQAANDASAGLKQTSGVIDQLGFNTTVARRELVVLAHEMSQGNYTKFGGSLMVLAEHSNLLAVAFSAAGLTAIAATAGIAAIGVAALMGSKEAEEFRKSLILTGNAAGQTSSSFEALAASAAASTGSTIGKSKDAVQALISSGRISQDVMGQATEATLLMEKLTGSSADEIVRDFGKMGDGVAKWAQQHNEQWHYLTAAQFAYIKQLEDQGRLEDAEKENLRVLNTRMADVNANLGALERGWKGIRDGASAAWDAMKGIGRADTVVEQMQKVERDIGIIVARQNMNVLAGTPNANPGDAKALDVLRQKLTLLQQAANYESVNAAQQARAAAVNEAAIKKIMDPPKAAAAPNMGALNSVVSATQKYLAESAEMLQTNQKLGDIDKWRIQQFSELAKQTQGLTALGRINAQVGIEAAASQMRQAEAVGKLAGLNTEADKIIKSYADQAKEIGLTADELERLNAQRKIEDALIKARAGTDPANVPGLVGAADQAKVTTDEQIKALQAARAAYNSKPDNGVKPALTAYFTDATNGAKRMQDTITNSLKLSEDAFVAWANTGKLSAASLFSYLEDQALRALFQKGVAGLITAGGGPTNFSFATLGSSIASLFSSHATGLDYVPYDGYPALLHKGERVQTAVQASSSNKGGANIDASINGLSVGAGVSLPQVHAAINQAVALSQAQMMRSLRQSGVAA